jgi:DNA repair ATPase RecN
MSNKIQIMRPNFSSSNQQYLTPNTPSFTEFVNLRDTVYELQTICHELKANFQEIKRKHDELNVKYERQQQFNSIKKSSSLAFDVQNFRAFLYSDFQTNLDAAATNLAWIYQIR